VSGVSRAIDRIEVTFDDETLVADAGLIVPATLMLRLGLEALVNQTLQLVGRVGGALPGRKVLTLVAAILAGGSHIDHANKLRAGATGEVLPFRVMAPSTLGTFLRAFTFGHIRQLDRVIAETIRRAWSLGAGPGSAPVTIDLDSTICEVHGKAKHGAAYGYTKTFGYHPILATRAETGEVLHARLRKGSSQRGAKRFVEELIARVRRAGASGAVTVRADAGFWNYALIDTLVRLGVRWSITVRINQQIRACIDAIDDEAWTSIAYPDGGEAQVAETVYVTGSGAPGSSTPPKRGCGPTGGTTRSSPTSSCPRSPSISSTATTQPSSSPSATSKRVPGSSTAPPVSSSPTPPGWAAPCWPTT
jgi:DDE family transposase